MYFYNQANAWASITTMVIADKLVDVELAVWLQCKLLLLSYLVFF